MSQPTRSVCKKDVRDFGMQRVPVWGFLVPVQERLDWSLQSVEEFEALHPLSKSHDGTRQNEDVDDSFGDVVGRGQESRDDPQEEIEMVTANPGG